MSTALDLVKTQLLATRPSFEDMNLNKLTFNKELEYAIQIFENNEYLLKCDQGSVKNCLVNTSLSGLSLNPVLKLAYLVPRKVKGRMLCCVDPSYMGLIKIVTDTGSVKSVNAAVVYEKDFFDIELGSKGYVRHKPYLGADSRGRKIGVYSIAVLSEGSDHIHFMRWDDIMAIKARSESVKAGKGSPWDTDEDEQAKKTAVKQQWKYLPKSERAIMAGNAIDLDNQANGIDFEAEQKAKAYQSGQNVNATPNAPAQEALATEEDVARILQLVNHEKIGDKFTMNGKELNKSGFITAVNARQSKNTLTKSQADGYIKLLVDLLTSLGATIPEVGAQSTEPEAKQPTEPVNEEQKQ